MKEINECEERDKPNGKVCGWVTASVFGYLPAAIMGGTKGYSDATGIPVQIDPCHKDIPLWQPTLAATLIGAIAGSIAHEKREAQDNQSEIQFIDYPQPHLKSGIFGKVKGGWKRAGLGALIGCVSIPMSYGVGYAAGYGIGMLNK